MFYLVCCQLALDDNKRSDSFIIGTKHLEVEAIKDRLIVHVSHPGKKFSTRKNGTRGYSCHETTNQPEDNPDEEDEPGISFQESREELLYGKTA